MDLRSRVEWMSLVVNKIATRVSVLFFIVMTLIIWVQIFYRFILGGGISWSEEIAKYMMVWMALLGSSMLLREGRHIAINYFISKFSFLRYILIFHTILSAILFVLLIYYGIDYAIFGYKLISPASGIRRFWPYLAIPVGGAFLLIQAFSRFIHLLFSDENNIRSEEEARARHELLSATE
ncbi:MAG: TRAP transporter small permease [Gammaproteobacteria bacterium]|jgi:TRAP-type transport system small permease protein